MAAPSVTAPSSTASANAALVGRFGRTVSMLALRYPSAGDSQSLRTGALPSGRWFLPLQPDQAEIRLHDVRHSYASAALAAGIPAKIVSERLGHATVQITLDTYSHVLPGLDAQAGETVAA
jgi:Phage integrase family